MADLELDLYAQQEEERKRQAATHMPAAAPAAVPVPTPADLAAITGPTPAAAAGSPMDLQLQQPPPEPAAAPLPPPPNLDSTHTTNTSQKTILSPEYKANLAGQKVNDVTQIQGLEEKGALDRDIAVKRQQQADEEVKFAAARSKAIGEAQSWGDEQIKTATDKFTAAQEQYRGRKIEDFWADKTTGTKVLAAVSVALGTLGAGISGGRTSNDALKIMESAINLDYQRQKANIEKGGQDLQLLRAGIGDARLAKADKLNDLNGRTAAAWGEVEAKFRASLAAKGVDAATIDNDARVVAARNQQLAFERQALEPTLKRVSTTIETVKNDPRLVAANAKAANAVKPGTEDVKAANNLVSTLSATKDAAEIIRKNPKAWDEVRENQKSWAQAEATKGTAVGGVRALGQAAGWANVSAEQGLKSPDAKRLHQLLSQVDTGIALGFGGMVTPADRESAKTENANLVLNGKEKLASLQRRYDSWNGNLESFQKERGVDVRPPAAAPPRMSQQDAAQVTDFIRKNKGTPAAAKAYDLLLSQNWLLPAKAN